MWLWARGSLGSRWRARTRAIRVVADGLLGCPGSRPVQLTGAVAGSPERCFTDLLRSRLRFGPHGPRPRACRRSDQGRSTESWGFRSLHLRKLLEDLLVEFRWNACDLIGDGDLGTGVPLNDLHRHLATPRREPEGVTHEVGDHPPDEVGIHDRRVALSSHAGDLSLYHPPTDGTPVRVCQRRVGRAARDRRRS